MVLSHPGKSRRRWPRDLETAVEWLPRPRQWPLWPTTSTSPGKCGRLRPGMTARDAGVTHAERHALRQHRSRPLTAIIKEEMETAQIAALPASALGKAISYTISLWHKLIRFLEHPKLE